MRVDLRDPARALMPRLPKLPGLAAPAVATWRARMINEHSSAAVFTGLAAQLEGLGLAAEADTCRGFAGEERRHGVLCGAVVEALGGEAQFDAPSGAAFPEHPDASRLEALARNLISVSCMSETVAVALIGAERLEMPEGELRALLTQIWADEVGHSRFGWRLLAHLVRDMDGATLARLGEYLRVAFAHLEEHELAHLNPQITPPPEGAALGLCNGRDARALFFAAVHEVIVPGLEALGLPARYAWEHRVAPRAA